MFEDKAHPSDELFDTGTDEAATNAADTIKDDEEGKKDKPSAEEIRKRSIETWKGRIERGEKTLDDIPPAQKWIKDAIGAKEKQPKSQEKVDIDQLLDKKLAEKEDSKAFTALKAQMDSSKLSEAQKKAILHEYEELRSEGGMKGRSLERALKIAGVRLEKDNALELKKAQRIPEASSNDAESDAEIESPFDSEGKYDITKGTSESRIKALEAERAKGLNTNSTGAKAYQRFKR